MSPILQGLIRSMERRWGTQFLDVGTLRYAEREHADTDSTHYTYESTL
jgi:hypothetical protein